MARARMTLTRSTGASIEGGLRAIAGRIDASATGISGLQRLSGGATQEIWCFDIETPARDDKRYILRRAPGGTRITDGTGLELEAELMAAAAKAGVPVAEVMHVLSPEDGLGHGFIMRFVEGETLGGRIVKSDHLRAARQTLAFECGETLARLHRIPAGDFPTLARATPAELVERTRIVYARTTIRRPVFDLAFRWLTDNAPPVPAEPKLVHGDFRNGNLMIGPDGLRAVLDWELAHVGDPMEDLGWICVNSWRFGRIDLPVGGFGTLDDLLAGYELISGSRLDRSAVHWWEVYGTIRWGAICAASVEAFRGEDATMERAMIARRTSETEIDLLRLIAS
ncbi:phosphotransferase family protein [Sphingopyxis sp.]|uniref:phosphotransferase family protein n=1 Tax=Sphingopyxis sp. TaxID=1908224 RepID=UPI002ED8A162